MSIIKFKARKSWGKIERITIEKETAQSVWFRDWTLNGGAGMGKLVRQAKASDYATYFDTWAEAKQFLLNHAEAEIGYARKSLENAHSYHGNIKGMKEPS